MKNTGFLQHLSSSIKNRILYHINKYSIINLIFQGILIYITVVILYSVLFWGIANTLGKDVLLNKDNASVKDFYEILYFNFLTTLTIAYGDYLPSGVGRFLAITEAFCAIGSFGSWVGVVVLKITTPSKDSIVFSNYCYYVEEENGFVVVFMNTTNQPLENVSMSSILKIGRDFKAHPAYCSPYIGESVWTFRTECLPEEFIGNFGNLELWLDDGLKFGIIGNYGFTNFTASKKYSFKETIVITNRRPLTTNPLLRNPQYINKKSEEFKKAFHYRPEGSENFLQYARRNGANINCDLNE